jgi:hypothetical protein
MDLLFGRLNDTAVKWARPVPAGVHHFVVIVLAVDDGRGLDRTV